MLGEVEETLLCDSPGMSALPCHWLFCLMHLSFYILSQTQVKNERGQRILFESYVGFSSKSQGSKRSVPRAAAAF